VKSWSALACWNAACRFCHWVAEQATEDLLAALTAFLAPYRDAAAGA
jgi:hypothetical protein